MKDNEVTIIGAGPSGISAAIQLKRYGIEPTILEKDEVGGLLKDANLVENYPGFPEGISGKHLAYLFEQQLKKIGIKVQFEEVLSLEYKKDLFFLNTTKRTMSSSIVIIATGTKPHQPDIKIPTQTEGRVFLRVRPLVQFMNKKIAIIGAGDTAFDYALNLSKKNFVYILNRSKKIKCLPLLWERAIKIKNISYFANITLKSIRPHWDGLILKLYNSEMRKGHEMHVSYLLFAIGRESCIDFLSDNVKNKLHMLQEIGVLHLIGDVKNGHYRQTAIAVGDGIKCAMKVYKKLREETYEDYS